MLRPLEPMLLKPFLPETEPVAIPVEHFHYGLAAIAESKEMTGEGVPIQYPFDHDGEAIDGFAHIDGAGGKENPSVGRKENHRRSRSPSN
jgi:hypothetical protein